MQRETPTLWDKILLKGTYPLKACFVQEIKVKLHMKNFALKCSVGVELKKKFFFLITLSDLTFVVQKLNFCLI